MSLQLGEMPANRFVSFNNIALTTPTSTNNLKPGYSNSSSEQFITKDQLLERYYADVNNVSLTGKSGNQWITPLDITFLGPPPPPGMPTIGLCYDAETPSVACSCTSPVTYWYDPSPLAVGSYLYTDSAGLNKALQGYYSDGTTLYTVAGLKGTLTSVVQVDACSGGNPPVAVEIRVVAYVTSGTNVNFTIEPYYLGTNDLVLSGLDQAITFNTHLTVNGSPQGTFNITLPQGSSNWDQTVYFGGVTIFTFDIFDYQLNTYVTDEFILSENAYTV